MAKILAGLDISYGIYIYHMPIANAFIESGFIENQKYFYSVLGIVIALSTISWIFLEKPLLNLKQKKIKITSKAFLG